MSAPVLEREVPPRKSPEERWAKTRQRGLFSFILRRGILFSGVLFAILGLLDRYFAVLPGAQWRGLLGEFVSFI